MKLRYRTNGEVDIVKVSILSGQKHMDIFSKFNPTQNFKNEQYLCQKGTAMWFNGTEMNCMLMSPYILDLIKNINHDHFYTHLNN